MTVRTPPVHDDVRPSPTGGPAAAAAALPRDLAASAMVLGIASAAWFAWGSTSSPGLLPWFLIGAVTGLAVAVGAALLRRGLPGQGSHAGPERSAVQRIYNRTLLGEVVLILIGNMALGMFDQPEYVICWTFAVVSVHFLPLAKVYRITTLRATAFAGLAVAGGGALLGILTTVSPGALVGGVGALVLLVSAAVQIRAARSPGLHADV